MLEHIDSIDGEDFDSEGYLQAFAKDVDGISLLWKLERQQSFREPDLESWNAFESGDVQTAVRLIEDTKPALESAVKAKTYTTRRIRIVEEPLTPYLWWEFHILKIRAEAGDKIVVVPQIAISDFENDGLVLPEIVGIDDRILWQVKYDETGVLCGARRITDHTFIHLCRSDFIGISIHGKSVIDYFNEVVSEMTPPVLRPA